MPRKLTNYEQETIINFNKGEAIGHIFTYEKIWQQHLEKKLGLKPVMDNGFGGREYEIDKKRIPIRCHKCGSSRIVLKDSGEGCYCGDCGVGESDP